MADPDLLPPNTRVAERGRGRPSTGLLFGLSVGVLVGVLAAVLVAPSRDSSSVTTGAGAVGPGAGAGGVATGTGDGVTGEAGAPAGGDPTGTGGGATSAGGTGGGSAGSGGGGTGSATPDGTGAGSGSSAGSGATGVTGGDPGAGGASAAAPSAGKIRIGFAHIDLGPLQHLGPGFDNGDRIAHMESILKAWREAGVLPVHGRDIEFVYKSYSAFSADEQRAACVYFAQDADVFAVMSDATFYLGMECLTREFRIPVVSSDAAADDVYERGAPYLFTVRMSWDRVFRNLVHWAHNRGLLKGKTIGLYSLSDPASQAMVDRSIRKELKSLGYKLAADMTTSGGTASQNDAVAVQQFQAAGVDLAILLAARPGFQQSAEAQRYRPTYIDSDWYSGTADITLTLSPPEQWDGTYAMSGLRNGDWNSGRPQSPAAQQCTENYRKASGASVDPENRNAEWISLTSGCDMATVLMAGLQGAGPDLTKDTFAAALEGAGNLPLALHPDEWGYGPGKHHGVNVQRTLQAHADCSCWRVVSDFEPLLVP